MKVRDKLIEVIDELDSSVLLRLYDIALSYKTSRKPLKEEQIRQKRPAGTGYLRAQKALADLEGSLLDDLDAVREDRY